MQLRASAGRLREYIITSATLFIKTVPGIKGNRTKGWLSGIIEFVNISKDN